MAKLKSRTGCLTCVTRKKKCDEALPKCGHCTRLGLACIGRGQEGGDIAEAAVTTTNLKARPTPLRVTITNGYPPFRSQLEKQLAMDSPKALQLLVSEVAADDFKDVMLFGTFCTLSPLAREAIGAFQAYHQGSRCEDSYKLALKGYQSCITKLMQTRAYEVEDPAGRDCVLTAITFLGLMEALSFGDSSNAVTHFEMARKLLAARLSQPSILENAGLVKLYRVVAECIMYNLATLSPFHTGIHQAASDWRDSFDCLFPRDEHSVSPFLGGFHSLYQAMFRTNSLLRQIQSSPGDRLWPAISAAAFSNIWGEVERSEDRIPASYYLVTGDEAKKNARLYLAKYRVSVLALKIQLVKISSPLASPSDGRIRLYFQEAASILNQEDVREEGNPALRWPLSILACAAETADDFELVVDTMKEIESVLDPANGGKLKSAYSVVGAFRQAPQLESSPSMGRDPQIGTQLDLLLKPQLLDGPATIMAF